MSKTWKVKQMDITLVSYLYFELGNMIILTFLGFLFCLHVARKNVKLDVRRKATKKNNDSMEVFVAKALVMG
jgi:hypothetical protein